MRAAVIGSGPSGVAAALTLADAGIQVEILDVGREPEPWSRQLAADVRQVVDAGGRVPPALLEQLVHGPEAQHTSLVDGLRTVLSGGMDEEVVLKRILGSTFVYEGIDEGIPVRGGAPPRTLARGGLSNSWGAACYPLRAWDSAQWLLPTGALDAGYARAAALLEVVQGHDGLEQAYPLYGPTRSVSAPNPGSGAERLVQRWSERTQRLARLGMATGRARVAVSAWGSKAPDHCRQCGLCFYGCPFGSIFSSTRLLDQGPDRVSYRPDHLVRRFEERSDGVYVHARTTAGEVREGPYQALFLAAGTLSSLRIAADSLGLHGQPVQVLDNDMQLVPAALWRSRVSSRFRSAFTLGEAVVALDPGVATSAPVHVQLYSFHDYFLAELGAVLHNLPAPARRVAWGALNQLLVAFVYLEGSESVHGRAVVQPGEPLGVVELSAQPNPASGPAMARVLSQLHRSRRDLGFVPLTPLAKATPMGFSGHLAGTLPMRSEPGALQTHPSGRLAGTQRVHVVDAAAFPTLPAQNLTLTTMANAIRVSVDVAHGLQQLQGG